MLYTCIIDAMEKRKTITLDIPNAFITTVVEKEEDMAIIEQEGYLVDVLMEIDPEYYKEYVWEDSKGQKHLITQCQNAIYGTMIASLLFYKKFVKVLQREGFELNPYDPCVANREVNGNQQTIVWHVDDCKVSHVNDTVNEELVKML